MYIYTMNYNGNRYFCRACNYDAKKNSNLIAHLKTKKHFFKINNVNIFQKKLEEIFKKILEDINIDNLINYDDYNILKYDIICNINQISFLSKTLDGENFICTGCGKYFEKHDKYEKHKKLCDTIK